MDLGHLQEELKWGPQNGVYKSCHGSHMAAAGTLISVQSVRGRIGLLQFKISCWQFSFYRDFPGWFGIHPVPVPVNLYHKRCTSPVPVPNDMRYHRNTGYDLWLCQVKIRIRQNNWVPATTISKYVQNCCRYRMLQNRYRYELDLRSVLKAPEPTQWFCYGS